MHHAIGCLHCMGAIWSRQRNGPGDSTLWTCHSSNLILFLGCWIKKAGFTCVARHSLYLPNSAEPLLCLVSVATCWTTEWDWSWLLSLRPPNLPGNSPGSFWRILDGDTVQVRRGLLIFQELREKYMFTFSSVYLQLCVKKHCQPFSPLETQPPREGMSTRT